MGSAPALLAAHRRAGPPSSEAPPPLWTAGFRMTCNKVLNWSLNRSGSNLTPRTQRRLSPAFEHAQGVELAGAAEGDDQQEAADEAADHRGSDDPSGNNDGAAVLIAAVATVVLRVTNPRLKDTAVILQKEKGFVCIWMHLR